MIGTDIYKKHGILIRRGHIGYGGGPGYTLHIPSPGTTLTAAEFRRMILDLVEHLLEVEYRGASMRPKKEAEDEKEWLTCSDCTHAREDRDMDNPESPCYKPDEDEAKYGDLCLNFIRKEASE